MLSDEYPYARVFSVVMHYFVLAKLASTSSIRVKREVLPVLASAVVMYYGLSANQPSEPGYEQLGVFKVVDRWSVVKPHYLWA